MATINFFIQSKNNPAGIYVRLREGRYIDAKAKTKFAIDPGDWSMSKGQPKNLKDANLKLLNENLANLSTDLLNKYNQITDKNIINTQWLKSFITPQSRQDAIPDKLIEYFNYYAKHKKSSIESSSYLKLKVNQRLVERFQVSANTVFCIKDVNADFKLKFEAYCKTENYAQNTIARALKSIKTICYHARDNGIETHFQLNSISGRYEKIDIIILSQEDQEKIKLKIFDHDYLNNARDWLIISCETGQRVSDLMRFTKEQIRYEGKVGLIEFTQVKTRKIMSIPLSKTVRSILENRQGEFPRPISDQKYNEYIKEVCQLAGLTCEVKGSKMDKSTLRKKSGLFPKYELVTSHIGRRSFATNNYGRIPTSLLMNVTGHSTESMFLAYIGKTVTEKAIQLAEYFQ